MQCLKINNGKGEFSFDGVGFMPLDEIKKEDILKLLDIALDPEVDFEMDEYLPENFNNPAHKVIYGNLHSKFKELLNDKDQFVDEVNEQYSDAYEKYKINDEDGSQGDEVQK